jgi:hypothetical protein
MLPSNKYDIIGNTLKNIQFVNNQLKYNKIPINDGTFYEVTNLVNNGLGLLSYVYQYAEDKAKEQHSKNTTQDYFELLHKQLGAILGLLVYTEERYGKIHECYPSWQPKDVSSTEISAIVHRMRNAICHCGIEFIGGEPDADGHVYIENIRFADGNDNGSPRFEAILTIEQYENLTTDVANAFVIYKKKNPY